MKLAERLPSGVTRGYDPKSKVHACPGCATKGTRYHQVHVLNAPSMSVSCPASRYRDGGGEASSPKPPTEAQTALPKCPPRWQKDMRLQHDAQWVSRARSGSVVPMRERTRPPEPLPPASAGIGKQGHRMRITEHQPNNL